MILVLGDSGAAHKSRCMALMNTDRCFYGVPPCSLSQMHRRDVSFDTGPKPVSLGREEAYESYGITRLYFLIDLS